MLRGVTKVTGVCAEYSRKAESTGQGAEDSTSTRAGFIMAGEAGISDMKSYADARKEITYLKYASSITQAYDLRFLCPIARLLALGTRAERRPIRVPSAGEVPAATNRHETKSKAQSRADRGDRD